VLQKRKQTRHDQKDSGGERQGKDVAAWWNRTIGKLPAAGRRPLAFRRAASMPETVNGREIVASGVR